MGARRPVANGLRDLGVQPGDRVAGLEDNNLDCVDLYLGCAKAGAVRVPLYPRNAREAHSHMIEGTDCKLVVADEVHADLLGGLQEEFDCRQQMLVRDTGYEGVAVRAGPDDPLVEIDADAWYVIRTLVARLGDRRGWATRTTIGC